MTILPLIVYELENSWLLQEVNIIEDHPVRPTVEGTVVNNELIVVL